MEQVIITLTEDQARTVLGILEDNRYSESPETEKRQEALNYYAYIKRITHKIKAGLVK